MQIQLDFHYLAIYQIGPCMLEEEAKSNYRTNDNGAGNVSYISVNTVMLLSSMMRDWR